MLFEGLRKRLWLASIKSVVELPSSLENKILKYKPQHISQLSRISKKYNRKDKTDQAIFRLSLKLLVNEPSKIDDSINAGDDIRNCMDQLVSNHAWIIAGKAKNELSSKIPGGCEIIDTTVHMVTVELLLSGSNDDEVYYLLIKNIKEGPSKFIDGYNDWLKKNAKALFDALHGKLQEGMPKRCAVNEQRCTDEIYNLLKNNGNADITLNKIAYDVIIGELYKKINEEPEKYVDGFMDLLNNAAENFFNQINTQLLGNLPDNISMNRENSMSFIRNLMKQSCEPSDISEKFLNEIKNNPRKYLVDENQKIQFESSISHSAGGDHAMLSTPPPRGRW